MITKEQIEKYCDIYPSSDLLWARLDYDFKVARDLIPVNTIVQLKLFRNGPANLYVSNALITTWFPYDAATLLEDEE